MLINIAQANLSKLISLAKQGEAITIARNNKPLVDLVVHQASKERQLGSYVGQVTIADDFDAQDENINSLFTGQDV